MAVHAARAGGVGSIPGRGTKIPQALGQQKIIIKDLRVDQIWISDLEEDPSLVFGLTLAFLLYAHKEIETSRGEMILPGALRQLGHWASRPCPPSGARPSTISTHGGTEGCSFPA